MAIFHQWLTALMVVISRRAGLCPAAFPRYPVEPGKTRLYIALALFIPTVASASPFTPLLDQTIQHYPVEGIAMAVIEDGQTTFTATRGEGITDHTRFKIASNTKAMTAAVLARLVQRGVLHWNDPVIQHLPQFRMHDPWVTEHMQVRDLLIHNSGLGLGAGDLMLWPEPNAYTRADIIAGLAHLKPVTSFRSGYAYDNLMYVVAGEVAAAAAGKPIDVLLQEELFTPLGMTGCQTDPTQTSLAAGGVRCSLRDMTRWMQVLLDPSLVPDWLNAEQRRQLWTAHMPMPLGERQRRWDNAHFSAYGYGWRLSDMDGQFKVAHTGTLSGAYSSLALLPDSRKGVVILINGEGENARTVLMQAALKTLIHATSIDQTPRSDAPCASSPCQNTATKPTIAPYITELQSEHTTRKPRPDTSARTPAPTTVPWQGIYQDPWLGTAHLCPENGKLRFSVEKSPRLRGTVMQLDSRWLVQWDTLEADAEPWLQVSPGTPQTLSLRAIDPDIDFSYDYQDLHFTRTGSCPR
ncbi:serine hydrolase domain-containing protein [Stenotrophomonas oahuensis]|uniref:Serine hydrolase n=1 Tax=Stenotrophomonas oahuensis TaxID=3003271 RepID=A0ABY9YU55_9GAMM|nr:serine hydrolase domain-containing protein [Stenotrophomonas sp. A5586]WNH54469.1 serine hydrolase [Stenotrophomonas sp. A5586]